jgi:hypothetical protein
LQGRDVASPIKVPFANTLDFGAETNDEILDFWRKKPIGLFPDSAQKI